MAVNDRVQNQPNLDDFSAAELVPLPIFLQEEDADRVRLGHEVLVAQSGTLHGQLDRGCR